MYDIKVIGIIKADDSPYEITQELREINGKKVSKSDLVAFIYKTYARRDIEIISVSVVQFVPQIISVTMSDDGNLMLNGKLADLDIASDVLSVTTKDNVPVVAHQPLAIPEQIVQQQDSISHTSAAPQTNGDKRQPEPIPRDANGISLLQIGEERWIPTAEEKAQGITSVITWTSPKVLTFQPAFETELPFKMNERIVVDRLVKFRNNDQEMYYVVNHNQGVIMIPETHLVESISQQAHRGDSYIELTIQQEDGQPVTNMQNSHNQSEFSIPLQVQSENSLSGGDPFVIKPRH